MAQVRLGERIVADPEILGGKPLIVGTRVTVEFILGQLGRGQSSDEVSRQYGVSREDVLAAIRFAAETVSRDNFAPAS
ncbi:MAG TPA: DUF433 domain-containing protein [Myxococcaceae bacterium]|nr:DUF433 domain-containing protein [Myxococcaceae bacterium]